MAWYDLVALPVLDQKYCIPSELSRLTLVSSDHKTLFQSSNVQGSWDLARLRQASFCLGVNLGFLGFLAGIMPIFLKIFVLPTRWHSAALGLLAFPYVSILPICRASRSLNLHGCLFLGEELMFSLFFTRMHEDGDIFGCLAIFLVDIPSRNIFFFIFSTIFIFIFIILLKSFLYVLKRAAILHKMMLLLLKFQTRYKCTVIYFYTLRNNVNNNSLYNSAKVNQFS